MNEIWPSLVPILLTDIVNPVLFAFMVYAVSTDRPIANSSALLLGHTVAYFVVGIVLATGLEQPSTNRLFHRIGDRRWLALDWIQKPT